MQDFNAELWLKNNPEIESLRAVFLDINGVMRGKRLRPDSLEKIIKGGIRMPLSTANVDIWGRDINDSPWVFESGDADGRCDWTQRGPLPINWTDRPAAMVPVTLADDDGAPFMGDARNALASLLARYQDLNIRPVTAFELEFYLVDPKAAIGDGTPANPLSGVPTIRDNVLSVDELNDYDALLGDIYQACEAQNVDVDAAISESGRAQFEVNLRHGDDALKVADDAVLFKIIAKGVARKHGLAASFMAKPFAERAGNGLHLHFSLIDQDGKNLFDNGDQAGSAMMHHALGGLLASMPSSMIFFAPHLNSYRRLAIEQHAPTSVCWGYENRTAAIRIPGGPPSGRRIEHRVAGCDTNPYLVMLAILGAALHGIEAKIDPAPPITASSYDLDLPQLPDSWQAAVAAFENDTSCDSFCPSILREMMILTKKQEMARFAAQITPLEFASYLDQV